MRTQPVVCRQMEEKFSTNLVNSIHELQQLGQWCDARITCPDKRSVLVHRLIVAAVSPYFRQKFDENFVEINVSYNLEIMTNLVKYFYSGEICITPTSCIDLFLASCKFQLETLQGIIERQLVKYLNTESFQNHIKHLESAKVQEFMENIRDKPIRQSELIRNCLLTWLNHDHSKRFAECSTFLHQFDMTPPIYENIQKSSEFEASKESSPSPLNADVKRNDTAKNEDWHVEDTKTETWPKDENQDSKQIREEKLNLVDENKTLRIEENGSGDRKIENIHLKIEKGKGDLTERWMQKSEEKKSQVDKLGIKACVEKDCDAVEHKGIQHRIHKAISRQYGSYESQIATRNSDYEKGTVSFRSAGRKVRSLDGEQIGRSKYIHFEGMIFCYENDIIRQLKWSQIEDGEGGAKIQDMIIPLSAQFDLYLRAESEMISKNSSTISNLPNSYTIYQHSSESKIQQLTKAQFISKNQMYIVDENRDIHSLRVDGGQTMMTKCGTVPEKIVDVINIFCDLYGNIMVYGRLGDDLKTLVHIENGTILADCEKMTRALDLIHIPGTQVIYQVWSGHIEEMQIQNGALSKPLRTIFLPKFCKLHKVLHPFCDRNGIVLVVEDIWSPRRSILRFTNSKNTWTVIPGLDSSDTLLD